MLNSIKDGVSMKTWLVSNLTQMKSNQVGLSGQISVMWECQLDFAGSQVEMK